MVKEDELCNDLLEFPEPNLWANPIEPGIFPLGEEIDQFVADLFHSPICQDACLLTDFQVVPPPSASSVRIKGQKKRKLTNSSHASSEDDTEVSNESIIAPHSKALSLDSPVRIAQEFTIAVNASDPKLLSRCFHEIFSADARIFKYIYNVQDFGGKRKPKNHFGKYTSAEMTCSQYMEYNQAFAIVCPDFTMDIGNHRVCYDKECSIYMSMFNFNGTIISQDCNLANTDKNGQVVSVNSSIQLTSTQVQTPFAAHGSMAMFRNPQGKIFRLEFYYEFTQ